MRSTFTKIFLSFWLTEALILVCTLFILTSQFEQGEAVYTSAFAMMESNAHQLLQSYQQGGCDAMKKVPSVFPLEEPGAGDKPALLFDLAGAADGQPLCQQIDMSPYAKAVGKIRTDGFLLAERLGPGFVQGVQVEDAQGHKYAYLMHGSFPKDAWLHFPYREMVPRLVIALVVSLFVTSLITILITRPIGLLRAAARQLASGNLRARVNWPKGKKSPKKGDELWALVYDFNNMADRLESVVDAQMLLLRDVSHELRSPLARLSVALELAREEAAPDSMGGAGGVETQLARIERETERLNTLIGQLLSLSHLESTKQMPEGQAVSLGAVVRELLPDMEFEAQGRHCQVRFAEAAPVEVQGSRELLGRAVENVIRNAIAYTAEGTAVEIRLSREERGGKDFAVLEVRDHGPGVPKDGLKSIFRPFFRLDFSRQRSTGGYGVGLAITERAIRLHGGEVEAVNASEGGLIVAMRLPVAKSA